MLPRSSPKHWRGLLRETRSPASNARLLQALCVAVAVAILPFAVYRGLQGQWLLGAIDALLVSLLILAVIYFERSARPELAGWVLAPLYCIGALVMYALQQGAHAFWLFPSVAANFVLLPLWAALGATLLVLIALGVLNALVLDSLSAMAQISLLVSLTLLASITMAFVLEVSRSQQLLSRLVTSDPLTGAGNRRALDEALREAAERFARHGSACTLLMFDLDHFKRVNDDCGHEAGDLVLVRLTRLVDGRRRVTDHLYRFGGEEFVLLLPDTQLAEGAALAEVLRRLLAEQLTSPVGPVTASFGCAQLQTGEAPVDWLARCDRAMYLAKQQGRNRVEVDSPATEARAASPLRDAAGGAP